MADALVLYEGTAPGVVTLTMNRPTRRNALSAGLVDALIEALARAAQDPDAVAVVLTGAGDRAFCAGGDLTDSLGSGLGALDMRASRGRFADLLQAVHDCPKPVVAALNGDALGGGFGLALSCDLVVADADAKLGTPEVRVGLFPMMLLAELHRNLPRKVLAELVFTGGKLTAAQALDFHLINRVAEAGDALVQGQALAARVARFSPAVLGLGKRAMYASQDMDYERGLAFLHGQLEANLVAEDAMEGISAFLQKRPAQWSGR